MHGSEFTELNAFVAVAERSSFAHAARHLGVVPSTISQTIRALEERLGVRLLNRTTRSVSLTDAGEKLLARIRPAIMELGAAVEDLNEFRDTPSGTLRLSVSNAAAQIVLAPVIRAFLAAYPAITLDITADDGEATLVGGRFDAGIHVGQRVARDMQALRVSAPSRLIAIASPAYLEQHPAPRVPEDLQRHNCIRLRTGSQFVVWEFARGGQKIEMSVSGPLIVNSMHLMVQATRDGIGIGYAIESYVAKDIAEGRLAPLLAEWSPRHHSYYLYYSGRSQLPVPLATFIAFLDQWQRTARAGAAA
jgi:DNA-binding transcriptional LysR family regulator